VRAISLHPDVIVATSRVWQTTCTIVRGSSADAVPAEAFVIDSPVYPDELEVLPPLLEQAGFPFSGLLATHGDWDHLLARMAFPEAPLGCGETTTARLTAEPGAAQRALREFDDEHYVERVRPLALGAVQALPVPGHCSIGDREIELHPTDGHTADGMALWIGWAGVLVAGDYLSAVEIPLLSPGGSVSAYLDTLARLRPLVEQATHVVPGHGPALDAERALEVLEADRAYLEALRESGSAAPLPRGRRSAQQRRHHAANVARAGHAPPDSESRRRPSSRQ
jgi:glyoxylase-like metal-dependent hydrolase (beta-lactamase superfamily II)